MVLPAIAHLSPVPFGGEPPWGGNHVWRGRREFVGNILYRARLLLWNPSPKVHARFPPAFREAAVALLCGITRKESPLYALRAEHVHIILNNCGYDWWGLEGLDERRREAVHEIYLDYGNKRRVNTSVGAVQAPTLQDGGALQCQQQ